MDKPAAQILWARVMHHRLRPASHRFVYPVFGLRLNLDRLAEAGNALFGIDCWRPLSLRTRDYGARDGSDLASWMRQILRDHGLPDKGEIWLQTFPRVWGYAFNPVSFWYCYDDTGALRAMLAEVNNTFGEHYRYLLSAPEDGVIQPGQILCCKKLMHVSPFCRVEGHYSFRIRSAEAASGVQIDYHDASGLLIRTAIAGKLAPLSFGEAARALLRHPLLTFLVVWRIHWQALRLWLKRVPFYRKPAPPALPALSFNLHEKVES